MKRKMCYSDYGFIGKNFENDSRTPFTVFSYPPHRDIEVGLICELHKDTLLVMSNA